METVLKITDIDKLKPAFDGSMGWVTINELNVIDPDASRFDIIDEATFEDGTVFVKVIYA